MGKLTEIAREDIDLLVKSSIIVDETQKIVGHYKVNPSRESLVYIDHPSAEIFSPIQVYPRINQISVASSSYFNIAMQLKEAYEKKLYEEFTIKKNYVESSKGIIEDITL